MVNLRLVRTADHPAIAEINTLAFGQPDEARLVERLRTDGDVLLEMVAEADGAVTGHILFSRLWADNGHLYAALAPMAVRPELQKSGIGSDLVRSGLGRAREFGAVGVLVLGHRDYYPRFGFSADLATAVRSPYSGSRSFMALGFEPDAFDIPFAVAYPNAFGG